MGNRLHSSADTLRSCRFLGSRRASRPMSMTKNKPLKHVSIQWSSQFPLTAGQLQRKREEFWDTAPAFEGRIEIWNALKAAADFLERNDYEMAQAILDGADIILPTGTLCDCYDRLGTRYQLPLYVLSEPSNLIQESATTGPDSDAPREASNPNSSSLQNPGNTANPTTTGDSASQPCVRTFTTAQPTCTTTSDRNESTDSVRIGCWPFPGCCHVRRRGVRSAERAHRLTPLLWTNLGRSSPTKEFSSENAESENGRVPSRTLRIRLSTGEDITLALPNGQITIMEAKKLLASQTQWPERRQRWFVCGHMLPNRARLNDCHIPDDFIVQVIVHSPFDPESHWTRPTASAGPPCDPTIQSSTTDRFSPVDPSNIA
ncbi:Ubiquitin domain-containing protein 1, variant 2 [Clonorchis sinensis]|uniref:Ubiquitin domain-containing protein 1, variant 2 n=1 Tax=Clonorchis sinensis TaxID=79923 RepID=A0A3R7FU95_CLOSI|nr:Ubiquitin domain-containing protein 1, variant 2 [Clonorchis sinensis]